MKGVCTRRRPHADVSARRRSQGGISAAGGAVPCVHAVQAMPISPGMIYLRGLGPRPTTRRGRYLWDRSWYVYLERQYWKRRWKWAPGVDRWNRTVLRENHVNTGIKQQNPCKSSKTYNALPTTSGLGAGWVLTPSRGVFNPPHVRQTQGIGWPTFRPRPDYHFASMVIGYHIRPVNIWHRRRRDSFWTARRRQINGANFYFWKNAYFPTWDVLGRCPNEDERPGTPEAVRPSGWPVNLRLND